MYVAWPGVLASLLMLACCVCCFCCFMIVSLSSFCFRVTTQALPSLPPKQKTPKKQKPYNHTHRKQHNDNKTAPQNNQNKNKHHTKNDTKRTDIIRHQQQHDMYPVWSELPVSLFYVCSCVVVLIVSLLPFFKVCFCSTFFLCCLFCFGVLFSTQGNTGTKKNVHVDVSNRVKDS